MSEPAISRQENPLLPISCRATFFDLQVEDGAAAGPDSPVASAEPRDPTVTRSPPPTLGRSPVFGQPHAVNNADGDSPEKRSVNPAFTDRSFLLTAPAAR